MKRRASILLAIVVLTTAGCGPGASEPAAQQETKAKVVEVFTVRKSTDPVLLTTTGLVEAKREAILQFGTSGTVSSLPVGKGSKVSQGQLLASLDTRYYQKEVEAAAGQVEEANARKVKTLKGSSEESIQKQRLQVQSSQQDFDKASQDVLLGEKLFAGGAISQSELDDRRRAKDQAQIQLQNDKLALEELLRGAEPEDVIVANASIKQAAGQVERAKKTLNDTKIVAPFAGMVVDVSKQVGELASPGEQVIQIVDLSDVKVTLDVANDVIGQYQENAKVQVVGEDGKKSEGTISFVSPVVDKQTGKYRVEVTVPNPQGQWKGGMVATVEIPRKLNGFLVPLESVGVSQSEYYVMAVENGLTVKRPVKTGQMVGDRIEVLSGVNDGDQLLRSGITFYVEGQKVEAKGE